MLATKQHWSNPNSSWPFCVITLQKPGSACRLFICLFTASKESGKYSLVSPVEQPVEFDQDGAWTSAQPAIDDGDGPAGEYTSVRIRKDHPY